MQTSKNKLSKYVTHCNLNKILKLFFIFVRYFNLPVALQQRFLVKSGTCFKSEILPWEKFRNVYSFKFASCVGTLTVFTVHTNFSFPCFLSFLFSLVFNTWQLEKGKPLNMSHHTVNWWPSPPASSSLFWALHILQSRLSSREWSVKVKGSLSSLVNLQGCSCMRRKCYVEVEIISIGRHVCITNSTSRLDSVAPLVWTKTGGCPSLYSSLS